MANNRMFLVHKQTGRAVFLAKRIGEGWYCPEDRNITKDLNDFFDLIDAMDHGESFDDYALAMETIDRPNESVLTNWDYDKSDNRKLNFDYGV